MNALPQSSPSLDSLPPLYYTLGPPPFYPSSSSPPLFLSRAQKQRAIQEALQIGEQIRQRRHADLVAAAFAAWRFQVRTCVGIVDYDSSLLFCSSIILDSVGLQNSWAGAG